MKKSQPYREEVNIDGKNPEKVLIRMLDLFDGRIVGEVTGHVETRIQGLIGRIINHHNGKPIKLTICRENVTNPESPDKPRIGAQHISIPLLDPYILSAYFEIRHHWYGFQEKFLQMKYMP